MIIIVELLVIMGFIVGSVKVYCEIEVFGSGVIF